MNNLRISTTKVIALSYCLLAPAMVSCKKNDIEIIGKTQSFKITSAVVKENYEIFVFLPPVYNSNTPQNRLTIGLDADFNFKVIANLISEKSQNGTITPCIYVGIGNSKNKNRDYTPTAFKHGTGGAQNFYKFITNELIRELEFRYKVDTTNTKTLLGHSFGVVFTQFAMFQNRESNPFNKFISVECSYWFGSGLIFEYEQKYADTHTNLPVKFFDGMGTLEGGASLASFEEMNERLKNRAYAGFQSEATLIKKHGHTGSAILGFKKGLDYVFTN